MVLQSAALLTPCPDDETEGAELLFDSTPNVRRSRYLRASHQLAFSVRDKCLYCNRSFDMAMCRGAC